MIQYSLPVIARAKAQAIGLSRKFEGCVLQAYADPASGSRPYTIGWGSTRIYGRPVHLDDVITQSEADAMQVADLIGAMAIVMQHVVPVLNGDQLGALTSFVNNIGPGEAGVKDGFVVLKYGASSTMLKMINAGNQAWTSQFKLWVNGDGKPMLGLALRRFAEEYVALGKLDMTGAVTQITGDV